MLVGFDHFSVAKRISAFLYTPVTSSTKYLSAQKTHAYVHTRTHTCTYAHTYTTLSCCKYIWVKAGNEKHLLSNLRWKVVSQFHASLATMQSMSLLVPLVD